jgi:DNA-binding transcriptional ArsR family regulator
MKERRDVFFAIADENRRAILALLARTQKPLSIGDIAYNFQITRAGVSKHIKVLSESRLVSTEYSGRENLVYLQAQHLTEVYQWVSLFEEFWTAKLKNVKTLIESNKHEKRVLGRKR